MTNTLTEKFDYLDELEATMTNGRTQVGLTFYCAVEQFCMMFFPELVDTVHHDGLDHDGYTFEEYDGIVDDIKEECNLVSDKEYYELIAAYTARNLDRFYFNPNDVGGYIDMHYDDFHAYMSELLGRDFSGSESYYLLYPEENHDHAMYHTDWGNFLSE